MMEEQLGREGLPWYFKYGITFLCGALVVLAVISARGIFDETEPARIYRLLCDGCFLAAVLLIGFGLMTLVSKEGTFDMAAYAITCLASLFTVRKNGDKDGEENKRATYYDFKMARKERKRTTMWFLVFVGLFYLAASGGFILLFEAATAI